MKKKNRVIGVLMGLVLGPLSGFYVTAKGTLYLCLLMIPFILIVTFWDLSVPSWGTKIFGLIFAYINYRVISARNKGIDDIDYEIAEYTAIEYMEHIKELKDEVAAAYMGIAFANVFSFYIGLAMLGYIIDAFVLGEIWRGILLIIATPFIYGSISWVFGIVASLLLPIVMGVESIIDN